MNNLQNKRSVPSKTKIEEAIEVHEELNPKIWNSDNTIKPDVYEKLSNIADEFLKYIETEEYITKLDNYINHKLWIREKIEEGLIENIDVLTHVDKKNNIVHFKENNINY